MCLSIEYSTKLCENAILEFSLSIQSWPYANMDDGRASRNALLLENCIAFPYAHTTVLEATYGPFGSVPISFMTKRREK